MERGSQSMFGPHQGQSKQTEENKDDDKKEKKIPKLRIKIQKIRKGAKKYDICSIVQPREETGTSPDSSEAPQNENPSSPENVAGVFCIADKVKLRKRDLKSAPNAETFDQMFETAKPKKKRRRKSCGSFSSPRESLSSPDDSSSPRASSSNPPKYFSPIVGATQFCPEDSNMMNNKGKKIRKRGHMTVKKVLETDAMSSEVIAKKAKLLVPQPFVNGIKPSITKMIDMNQIEVASYEEVPTGISPVRSVDEVDTSIPFASIQEKVIAVPSEPVQNDRIAVPGTRICNKVIEAPSEHAFSRSFPHDKYCRINNVVSVVSVPEEDVKVLNQPIHFKSSCLDDYHIPQSVDPNLPAEIFAEDVAEAPDNSEPTLPTPIPSNNTTEASSESVHSEFSFSDGMEQMDSPDARGPAAGGKSVVNTIPLSDLSFDIYEVAYDLTSMSKWELDIRAGAASEAVDEFFRTHWKFPLVENFGHGEIVLRAGEIVKSKSEELKSEENSPVNRDVGSNQLTPLKHSTLAATNGNATVLKKETPSLDSADTPDRHPISRSPPNNISSPKTHARSSRNGHDNNGVFKQESPVEKEKRKAVNERCIVYVGNIPIDYTERKLKARFQKFGTIKGIQIKSKVRGDLNSSWSEDTMNYGFITFSCIQEAAEAIEKGNDGYNLQFQLSFGARRQFLGVEYKDLDGIVAENESSMYRRHSRSFLPQNQKEEEDDFAALLKSHTKALERRGVKPQPFRVKC